MAVNHPSTRAQPEGEVDALVVSNYHVCIFVQKLETGDFVTSMFRRQQIIIIIL